jgi:integrase
MAKIGRHPIANMRARDVTRGNVKEVLAWAVNELDLAESAVHKIRNHLNMAFNFGLDGGYCSVNPCARIKLPGNVRKAQKPVFHGADEFRIMRQYLVQHPSVVNVGLLVALLTGLRSGEIMGICWDAINWETGYLEVKREMQRSKGGRVLTLVPFAKTIESVRAVEMRPDLITALHWWRSEQRRQRMASPVWRNDDDLVFTLEEGRRFSVGTLGWHNAKACRAAGIKVVSPHKLRHTNLSMLLDAGIPEALVAAHAGHASTRMLRTTYEHAMHPQVSTAVLG